jgi:hypothetical protein
MQAIKKGYKSAPISFDLGAPKRFLALVQREVTIGLARLWLACMKLRQDR